MPLPLGWSSCRTGFDASRRAKGLLLSMRDSQAAPARHLRARPLTRRAGVHRFHACRSRSGRCRSWWLVFAGALRAIWQGKRRRARATSVMEVRGRVRPLSRRTGQSGMWSLHQVPSRPLFPFGNRQHVITRLSWMQGLMCTTGARHHAGRFAAGTVQIKSHS